MGHIAQFLPGLGFLFSELVLSLENENFDSDYNKLVDMDIGNMSAICEAESNKIDPVM